MALPLVPKGICDQGHCTLLGFFPRPQRCCFLCFLGAGLRRGWKQRAESGSQRSSLLSFPGGTGRGGGWQQLVLSEARACLRGQIAPHHCPLSRQHASLLHPDWPRPALNSWRLISFTKVKGARLRGGLRQHPRPFYSSEL